MDTSIPAQTQRDFQHELDLLKKQRYNQLPQIPPSPLSLRKRFLRRFQELRKRDSFLKVMGYCVNRVFKIIQHRLHFHIWQRWQMARSAEKHGVKYAVCLGGGLGDALMAVRFVRDFQHSLDHACTFDVFFYSPGVIAPFLEPIKGFEKSYSTDLLSAALPHYDFVLNVFHFVELVKEHIRYRVLAKRCPEVLKRFEHLQVVRKEINDFIVRGRHLRGIFSDWAMKRQHKRYSYMHSMMGVPYGGHAMPIKVDHSVLDRFGLKSKQFMTIHDGWDTSFNFTRSRPIKALPFDTWVKLVQQIKAKRPQLTIVQLGANTGENIPGVDVNLKNQLSFSESTSVLAHSAVHLDVESGLVHLGTLLGIRSVVMFGPTNLAWFGYPENINIPPKQCGNCWWVTADWMSVCPLGQENPVCMNSVDVNEVVNHVLEALT